MPCLPCFCPCPGKSEYWFNTKTSESRWNTPPSCGWKRLEVAHQPYTYSNVITGQTTHSVPNALSWKRVRVNDSLLWYNWKVRVAAGGAVCVEVCVGGCGTTGRCIAGGVMLVCSAQAYP